LTQDEAVPFMQTSEEVAWRSVLLSQSDEETLHDDPVSASSPG